MPFCFLVIAGIDEVGNQVAQINNVSDIVAMNMTLLATKYIAGHTVKLAAMISRDLHHSLIDDIEKINRQHK